MVITIIIVIIVIIVIVFFTVIRKRKLRAREKVLSGAVTRKPNGYARGPGTLAGSPIPNPQATPTPNLEPRLIQIPKPTIAVAGNLPETAHLTPKIAESPAPESMPMAADRPRLPPAMLHEDGVSDQEKNKDENRDEQADIVQASGSTRIYSQIATPTLVGSDRLDQTTESVNGSFSFINY